MPDWETTSATFQITAAAYPSFNCFDGGMRFALTGHAFLWMPVSLSGVNVTSGGVLVKSTTDVPPFQVPSTCDGGYPVPLWTSCVPLPGVCCQSPVRSCEFGSGSGVRNI